MPCQHWSLSWSHVNTLFAPKSCQHSSLPWSHDKTSFASKSCQHSSLSWSHVNTPHSSDLYNKATTAPTFRGNIAQTSRVHSTVTRHQDFRDANKTLKMHKESLSRKEMPTILWRCQNMPLRILHCTNMPIEARWCNTDFRYMIYYHSRGSWCCQDFRNMMWNDTTQKGDDVVQISELWSGTT